MRLNKFLAENTDLSRRKADSAIESGRVEVNNEIAVLGTMVGAEDSVILDGKVIVGLDKESLTILINKPVGYVCSKDGQGAKTIYDLLPEKYASLNIAGRLDKDSSGLVILTNDGKLLNELTHPSNNKEKVYEVTTDKELSENELDMLVRGVDIGDERPSKFKKITALDSKKYIVTLEEGRNRQIRRSFEAIGYKANILHRIKHGSYVIETLAPKQFKII